MIKPEKFGHLHLVYHFTVPLSIFSQQKRGSNFLTDMVALKIKS